MQLPCKAATLVRAMRHPTPLLHHLAIAFALLAGLHELAALQAARWREGFVRLRESR